MAPAPRRSGRTRIANTKYQSAGWDKDTLRLLRESSESSNPTSEDSEPGEEIAESAHDDEEFNDHDKDDGQGRQAAVNNSLSASSRSGSPSHVATPEAATPEDAGDPENHPTLSDGGDTVKQARWRQPTPQHSRGLMPVERGRSARGGVWQYIFGPEIEDLEPILRFKERWLFRARDITSPSRLTLQEARQDEWSQYTQAEEMGPHNLDRVAFGHAQVLSQISIKEAKARRFMIDHHPHQVLLGPWSQQRSHDLPFQEPLDIGKAWLVDENDPDSTSYHSGWLLNVGEKPQCVAWAPRQGNDQFLAIACRSTPRQRGSTGLNETTTSPAFSPSPAYPNSIFIWRVSVADNNTGSPIMRTEVAPQLVQVLACNFGDFRQVTWISHDDLESLKRDSSSLGILTILTTDGSIRMLEVPRPPLNSREVTCLEVHDPRFQVNPPPDTVFTCFDFASLTDLVLGLSTGSVQIYNIAQRFRSTNDIQPYLDIDLHNTYVIALRIVDYSERSHLIASSSANGTIKLTDLYSPYQDSVAIPRARIPSRNLIVVPNTYTIVTNIDNTGNTEPRGNGQTTVVGHNLRHFYTSQALSRFPESGGTATVLAGSPIHPYILIANTSGSVWTQNAIRRIYPTGRAGSKTDGGAWVQKVVESEWIPRPNAQSSSDVPSSSSDSQDRRKNAQVDLYNGLPVRPGLSRLNHGFKPEKLDLSNMAGRKRKTDPNGDVAVQVVFEDEQAVTAMGWNPNPVTAGWAAIGWGSGVVWITDLSHDAT